MNPLSHYFNLKNVAKYGIIPAAALIVSLTGCSVIRESGKTVWGTSTRALEEARANALSQTYQCRFEDCFSSVLSLARNEERVPLSVNKVFEVFLKDYVKGHIVVIGIEGNVNTTEVGIFFETVAPDQTHVEISSLSTSAKERVAKAVFNELGLRFSEQY